MGGQKKDHEAVIHANAASETMAPPNLTACR
jgi:hypothetical protein